MMPPSQSNALVPKRAKTVINLKAKAAERETREKLSGYEKDLERMKRDLKREETEENRLKRERDDMAKKLRRKKDDGTSGGRVGKEDLGLRWEFGRIFLG